MKLWEFKKLKTFPNFFLFYGDEFYLDFYYQKILSQIQDSEILKFYYDEFDFDTAKNHLAQNSLFGDKNTLIIKTDKFPSNVEKLVNITKDNNFYLFFYGDAKKAKTKPFKNNFVRFFKPDLRELILISNEYMEHKNIKNINLDNLKYLISKVDYRFLLPEIDKLALIEDISYKTIDKLVFNYNETSFDEVFDDLFLGKEYLKKLEYLLFQGNDEIAILLSFIRYIKILYMFNLHIKNIGFENVSRDVLGYQIPKNLEELRKKVSFSIKEDKFLEFFEILLQNELEMKSSKDKSAVLFKTFIQIKNLI